MSNVKTPDQIKAEFRAKGMTTSQWARDHGYSPRDVILVINGISKARYGKGHEIAVQLGLKPGANQHAA